MKSFSVSELIPVLLTVFGLILLSDTMFGSWAGNAKYFLTEIALLLAVVAFIKLRGLNIAETLRWKPIHSPRWIDLTVLSLSCAILLHSLDNTLIILMSTPPEFLESIRVSYYADTFGDLFWIFIGIGIAAPLVEESIFRGLFQRTLESKYSAITAIGVTSIIFALMHLQVYWFIQLFIISLITGYMSWNFKSIIPAVAIHSANNLWSLVQINYLPLKIEPEFFWIKPANLILLIFASLGFIFALKRMTRDYLNQVK